MAKAKQTEPEVRTLSQIIHISRIAWFKETNLARQTGDYGDTKALQTSFVERGWKLDGDGTVEAESIPDMYRDRAMREREDMWATLKAAAAADSNKLVDLKTFEEIYTDGGKLRPVDLLGLTGNRRSSAFFPAMIERKRLNQAVTVDVPVTIKHYENELDRLFDQGGENEQKMIGFKEMSDVDRLLLAVRAVNLGASQADLRKAFKDGTGQKMWGTIVLNKRFPELALIERMRKGPEDDGFIRLSSVKTAQLPNLVLRTDPEALKEYNDKKTKAGKSKDTLDAATQADVEKFFTDTEGGNAPKIMKTENIKSLAESSVKPLALVAKGIVNNDRDVFKHYEPFALGFNAFDELIIAGDGPRAEVLLTRLARAPKAVREIVYAELVKVFDGHGV